MTGIPDYVAGTLVGAGNVQFDYDFTRIHRTIAHELVHAFGYEGHPSWHNDEENIMATHDAPDGAARGEVLRFGQWKTMRVGIQLATDEEED